MFAKTDFPYKFKYLITGISGPGIECVYLPPPPPEEEILFKDEQKFVRPEPSEQMKRWMEEFEEERDGNKNESYVHAHQEELNEWEDREFKRCEAGVYFWSNGVLTYITGDYYKYLTQWQPLFGFPEYRESDKEVFYWIKYWEEDKDSFGGILNTRRREGKSTKMGFWITNRTSSNFKHLAGMQGQDDVKIVDFYNQMVINPFYKLPYYSKPIYDTNTLQKKGIIFNEPAQRNKRKISTKKKLVLESQMDYRTSEAGKYDQAKLNSYVMEEPGKLLKVNVEERWAFVKECLKLGINIIGKAFLGTTVEFMDVTDKGGKAYRNLVYDSDFNKRNELNRTESGLYAALMPADCSYEGLFDEWGVPRKEEARSVILKERKSSENNPKKYSGLIRKYPLNWNEVFYTSSEKCEFNAKILQDTKNELMAHPHPIRRCNAAWENNVRFSKIVVTDDPVSGWLDFASFIDKDKWNNVGSRIENGQKVYFPKNDLIFRIGVDPIDHGVRVEGVRTGDDDFTGSRRSRPVVLAKRLYDSNIDGAMTQDILVQRAKEKYKYKTGIHVLMMKVRPDDPNVFFERLLMICWLLGCKANIESQKPGAINWLKSANCGDFLWQKYVPEAKKLTKSDDIEGTPASPMIIQEYTGLIATDVEYFGHTYPFIEVVEDDLQFDPNNTREFDFTVAQGNLELACKMRDRKPVPVMAEIGDYLPIFDRYGNVVN